MREALVNALMDRYHSITGSQFSVDIYDDRVEIMKPGGLPRGLSVEVLGEVSIRRNELIVHTSSSGCTRLNKSAW